MWWRPRRRSRATPFARRAERRPADRQDAAFAVLPRRNGDGARARVAGRCVPGIPGRCGATAPGFQSENVLTVDFWLPESKRTERRDRQFLETVVSRASASPRRALRRVRTNPSAPRAMIHQASASSANRLPQPCHAALNLNVAVLHHLDADDPVRAGREFDANDQGKRDRDQSSSGRASGRARGCAGKTDHPPSVDAAVDGRLDCPRAAAGQLEAPSGRDLAELSAADPGLARSHARRQH